MTQFVTAILVRYGLDGEYLEPPLNLQALMVRDVIHGPVLEIVLPAIDSHEERAILITASALQGLALDPCPGLYAFGEATADEGTVWASAP